MLMADRFRELETKASEGVTHASFTPAELNAWWVCKTQLSLFLLDAFL